MISLLSPCYISTDSTISPVKWPRYSFSRKGRRAVSRFADSWNQPLQPWNRHQQSPMIGRGYMLYPIFPSVINMLPVLHPILPCFINFYIHYFHGLSMGSSQISCFFSPAAKKADPPWPDPWDRTGAPQGWESSHCPVSPGSSWHFAVRLSLPSPLACWISAMSWDGGFQQKSRVSHPKKGDFANWWGFWGLKYHHLM